MSNRHDYAPDRLRRYLRRYHEIALMADDARGIRYDGDRVHRGRDPLRDATIKSDVDLALGWLQTMDQRAALFVFEHYIGWGDDPARRLTANIADRFDLSQSQVHRIITAAIREMSEYLGYRSPLDGEASDMAATTPSLRS